MLRPDGIKDKRLIIPNEYNNDEDKIVIYYLNVDVLHAKNLKSADFCGNSDPYCEVVVNEQMRRTQPITNSINPVWNAKFIFFAD